jgi:hypothetical protein
VAGSSAAKKPLRGAAVGTLQRTMCVFATLVEMTPARVPLAGHDRRGVTFMKKLALGMAAVLALLSIAGCAQYYGKGKAPPPVVTKG